MKCGKGCVARCRFITGSVTDSLLRKSKQQIPRGLKLARDDKRKKLTTAYLKVRPVELSFYPFEISFYL